MVSFKPIEGGQALQYFKPADLAAGEEFEGIVIERWSKTFDDGSTQITYKLFTKYDELIGLNSCWQLDDLMAYVPDGAYVLIRYLGKVVNKKGNAMHTFEVHQGEEDSETANLRSRAPKPKPPQQAAPARPAEKPKDAKTLFNSTKEIPF